MAEPQAVSSPDFKLHERLNELAKPKPVKETWNFCRRLISGNQETIWPLSPRALVSRPSSRILDLAKPKMKLLAGNLQDRAQYLYSCGRVSEIWSRPSELYFMTASERLLQLAEPRKCLEAHLRQRPRSSPQWPVSASALSCKASQRILGLAQPRRLHPSFVLPKESETPVSRAALRNIPSPRIEHLAQPIIKKQNLCYNNRSKEAPIRPVSQAALQAMASPRLAELAKPKALPFGALPDRANEWPVSTAAKHAVATPRLDELAQPPKRQTILEGGGTFSTLAYGRRVLLPLPGLLYRAPTNIVQFNPEAFTVKESAKKAYCSERIKKLAEPIQRS